MQGSKELLELIKENPDLPVVPMVGTEVVADDTYCYWMGSWGRCKVTEYYIGREHIHFKDDEMEDVLEDMVGCKFGETKDGRDIWDDLSDEEWKDLFESLPWIKAIIVHIESP